ncbi:MAG: hypothetical protein HY897_05875 [Deltaproteobacteria bacterium]|nr:hypothetical protein [Deltaproteobacteria bacterium]
MVETDPAARDRQLQCVLSTGEIAVFIFDAEKGHFEPASDICRSAIAAAMTRIEQNIKVEEVAGRKKCDFDNLDPVRNSVIAAKCTCGGPRHCPTGWKP